ncbi:hypothetical protein LguiA_006461 [Lonicera macranthoides]
MMRKTTLLITNCILLSIGNCGTPLIMRLYFLHGGKRIWLSSFLLTSAWPFILIPLTITYPHRPPTQSKFFLIKTRLFFCAASIGILAGLDDYLYAYGVARLPVSTSSLIIATQLAFTAGFAYLLVKQKFTSYSVNAVFLLTVGAAVLALHTSGDQPEGESVRDYVLGFVTTLAAAALYGFILPVVELVYKKAEQAVTYTLVLEIQMVMCLFATLFCALGMFFNNDFKVLSFVTHHL